MLGSFEEEEPLVVPISVIIADWSTAEIKAELRKYQYLTEDRILQYSIMKAPQHLATQAPHL